MREKFAILRGDVVVVDLDPVRGSEQGKVRPCVVLQNDVGNQHSPVTIVASLTSRDRSVFDTEVEVKAPEGGLRQDSLILLNQIRTVDRERIVGRWGSLSRETMTRVDRALRISLALLDD